MRTLVIDRAKHLTGTAFEHAQKSGLRLRKSGLQCCLGFYGDQMCGLPQETLNQNATLDTGMNTDEDYQWLFGRVADKDKIGSTDISVQDALVSANDDNKAHPIRREARIAKLFKKYGNIEVKFVGDRGVASRVARRVYA